MKKAIHFLKNLIGHIKTIRRHKRLVRKHCFACGLYWQGLIHDLSKYSFAELVPSIRYYQGYRSPYTYQKEIMQYSDGWLHHKGRNKHHYEYWYDTRNHVYQPIDMPLCYIIESVCDRLAACKNYEKERYTNQSAYAYFHRSNDAQNMTAYTSQKFYEYLSCIKDDGEQKAFAKMKQDMKTYGKYYIPTKK